MVQQCSENQYLWEHFTVCMCVERLNSFGARQIVLCKVLLKQSCWTLSNVRCLCVLYRVRVRRVIIIKICHAMDETGSGHVWGCDADAWRDYTLPGYPCAA
jgi:hypothetical protein